jgi:haloalkane dehalogenase
MNAPAGFRNNLYPFTGSRLDLGGISLHYLDEGSGDPILLLHGNPTWSFLFRNLILGLKNQYRLIAPDHIGCGLSDRPDDSQYRFTLDQRARDVERLIDHLNIQKPITLVLHDWGGMIGMTYASRHPRKIGRIILLNTAAFHLPKTTRLPLSLWMCRKTWLSDFLIRQTGLFCKLTLRWGCCQPMAAPVRDGYLHPCANAKNRLAHLRFVQDIPLKPGDPGYSLISEVESRLALFQNTPALILWGMKDFVFDKHFLEVWRQKLPQAQVHEFPNAGHLALEDEGDRILSLTREFLKKNPIR